MNKVILTGRITKDPEIRYTSSGIASVQFSLAVDRPMSRDANGNRQADFINCVAWRGQADFLSRFVHKGNLLCIEGRISTRTYQAQDNQTRYVTEVIVDQLENLSPRDREANNEQGNKPTYQTNNYNNPGYGAKASEPREEAPSDNYNNTIDVADDDLPF